MRSILALLTTLSLLCFPQASSAEFPEKPLKIVVYTGPGGLIDITARKAAAILQERHLSVPVVVENKKGAGGIVAVTHLLRQRSDGHTILGLTSSVISKLASTNQDSKLKNLHFLARMVEDYECVITQSEGKFASFEKIKSHQGDAQIWAGPATGGTDHLFALKLWKQAGIEAKWIPYPSGSEAIAALMGGHAHAYVGNPQDIAGRPGLKVAAVAAPERLPEYPDTPTFKELGYDALTGESLWRGFAVRKGTPPGTIAKLEQLFVALSKDTEWKKFLRDGNVIPVLDTGERFAAVVQDQLSRDREFLVKKAS